MDYANKIEFRIERAGMTPCRLYIKKWGYFAALIVLTVVQVAEATQLKIILRYDDYSRSSNLDVEQALFEATKSLGGSVLVGVIPFPGAKYPTQGTGGMPLVADLDEKKIGMLQRYASQGVIEIAVHGFSHKNNAAANEPNSEFTGIPEHTQSLLLSTAKASLEKATGLRINSFIPPYNQYDNQTLKALESNGYKLLSAGLGGPTLRGGNLTYLPSGPYPQRLKDLVLSALSKSHMDAIVVSTIHPYDIVESGAEMADFRSGSPKISIQTLIDDLRQIKQLNDVRFMSIRELFESGEDLSPDRIQANLKLRGSFVTRHRLLPEAFNAYPLTGLYYSQDSVNRMYLFQISVFALLYGVLALLVTFITTAVLRRIRNRAKNIKVLAGAISVGGIFALLTKSLSSGFYITSAIGLICCIGVLVGIVLTAPRTRKLI